MLQSLEVLERFYKTKGFPSCKSSSVLRRRTAYWIASKLSREFLFDPYQKPQQVSKVNSLWLRRIMLVREVGKIDLYLRDKGWLLE